MGKPKNSQSDTKNTQGKQQQQTRKHKQQHGRSHKTRKVGRYWIEDVREMPLPNNAAVTLTVVITRVELHDEHMHHKKDITTPDEKGNTFSQVEGDDDDDDDDNLVAVTPVIHPVPVVTNSDLMIHEDDDDDDDDPNLETADATISFHTETTKPVHNPCILIRRAQSATSTMTKYPHQDFRPLPNGNCGDEILNPYPKSEVADKFWAQRKRLFSRYDEGIIMDKEGWYSVTPEAIATHLSDRIVAMHHSNSLIVLDAFAGCGGNVIAFARNPQVSLVLCVDTDLNKLRIVAHNAKLYGIDKEKIILLHCDACKILEAFQDGKRIHPISALLGNTSEFRCFHGFKLGGLGLLPDRIDAIFLSPPWGGMDYEQSGKRNYSLSTCIHVSREDGSKYNGEELLQLSAKAQRCVIYFLPRNVNGLWLGQNAFKAGYRQSIELEQHNLNGKLKTLTAYFGYTSSTLLK